MVLQTRGTKTVNQAFKTRTGPSKKQKKIAEKSLNSMYGQSPANIFIPTNQQSPHLTNTHGRNISEGMYFLPEDKQTITLKSLKDLTTNNPSGSTIGGVEIGIMGGSPVKGNMVGPKVRRK